MNSADYLGDRQMKTLKAHGYKMFVAPHHSTQSTTRAARSGSPPSPMPTWSSGSPTGGSGLPAYVIVDMVTEEVKVVRLPEEEGMKYSF